MRWFPYLLLGAFWFAVSAILPGPALFVALLVSLIGLGAGVVRYRHDATAELPSIVFVGTSLLAGFGALFLAATAIA